MKKKISLLVICLTVITLTACGTEETKSTKEVNNVAETEETVEDIDAVPEVIEENASVVKVDAEETAEEEVVADGYDVTLGEEMTAKDGKNNFLSDLPEIHLWMPSSDIEDTTPENAKENRYCIAISDEASIHCYLDMTNHREDHCPAHHIDYVEYGRYIIDYSWCTIAVEDLETETAIEISFGRDGNSKVDYDRSVIEEITMKNVEYIKEQVSSWDQNFVSEVPKAVDQTKMTEEEIAEHNASFNEDFGTLRYVGDNGMVAGIDNFLAADTTITFYTPDENICKFSLIPESDTVFSGMDGDTLAFYADIENGVMECWTDNAEYEAYTGIYKMEN